jgi:hypothetical protein
MITLEYRNTFKDTLALMRYTHTHSWPLRIIFAVFVLITLKSVVTSIPSDHSLGIRIFTGVFMEIVLLSVFTGVMTLVSILSMISKRNRTFHTDHTITLDESGLTEATPYNTSAYRWKAIQKVVQTRQHLFLFIAQHSAHVIPRRAVTSEDKWKNLHDTILTFTQHEAPNKASEATSEPAPSAGSSSPQG